MKKLFFCAIMCIMALAATAQPPQDTTRGPRGNQEGGRGPMDKNPFFLDPVFKHFMVKGYAQAGYTFLEKDATRPEVTPTFIQTPMGPVQGPPEFKYPKSNTFDMKRAYIFCRAQFNPRWYFWLMYDFCGVFNEYYVDFAAMLGGQMNFRMGQFKHPFGLENPYSPTKVELIDIYSQATTYLAGCGSDPLYGVQYGRDLGAMMYGDIINKHLHYELAILNGQGVNSKDRNNKKDFAARLEIMPTDNFKIVTSGQTGYGNADPNTNRRFEYTPNINPGDDYERHRWSIGAEYRSTGNNINQSRADYWHVRPLVVRAEYLGGNDGGNMSDGAYITTAIPFYKDFDFIASFDYFNYNKDLAGMEQTKYIVGIQYWFYRQCRLQAQYIYTDNTGTIGKYSTVQLQAQVAF